MVRGIRGAITVSANTKTEIINATKKLLLSIQNQNNIILEDIASVLFTTTADLDAAFPAAAAREMKWTKVPLICAKEIGVPGSLPLVVRVLLHFNTDKAQSDIVHVYLEGASVLRDDI